MRHGWVTFWEITFILIVIVGFSAAAWGIIYKNVESHERAHVQIHKYFGCPNSTYEITVGSWNEGWQ